MKGYVHTLIECTVYHANTLIEAAQLKPPHRAYPPHGAWVLFVWGLHLSSYLDMHPLFLVCMCPWECVSIGVHVYASVHGIVCPWEYVSMGVCVHGSVCPCYATL